MVQDVMVVWNSCRVSTGTGIFEVTVGVWPCMVSRGIKFGVSWLWVWIGMPGGLCSFTGK